MELPCDVFFVTNVSTTLISYKWDYFYWKSPNQNLYFWTLFWLRSSPIRLKEVTLTYSFPKFVRLVFWPKNRKTEEIRSLFRSSRPVQDLTKFILEKKNPHVTWSASATTFSRLAQSRNNELLLKEQTGTKHIWNTIFETWQFLKHFYVLCLIDVLKRKISSSFFIYLKPYSPNMIARHV